MLGISLVFYITNTTLHDCLELGHFSSRVEKLNHSFVELTREICDEYIKFMYLIGMNCRLKQSFQYARCSHLEVLLLSIIVRKS